MAQGGRPSLPSFTRMSEAEAHDLNLFVAPERLFKSRRMLATGLFRPALIEAQDASNGNRV